MLGTYITFKGNDHFDKDNSRCGDLCLARLARSIREHRKGKLRSCLHFENRFVADSRTDACLLRILRLL